MKKMLLSLVVAAATLLVLSPQAEAGRRKVANRWSARIAQTMPWHADYYYAPWGNPVPLVVPPTAQMQTTLGWGVAQSGMQPIHHQFGRAYPGQTAGARGALRGTPRWPSHTDQFGVYYVRGPW